MNTSNTPATVNIAVPQTEDARNDNNGAGNYTDDTNNDEDNRNNNHNNNNNNNNIDFDSDGIDIEVKDEKRTLDPNDMKEETQMKDKRGGEIHKFRSRRYNSTSDAGHLLIKDFIPPLDDIDIELDTDVEDESSREWQQYEKENAFPRDILDFKEKQASINDDTNDNNNKNGKHNDKNKKRNKLRDSARNLFSKHKNKKEKNNNNNSTNNNETNNNIESNNINNNENNENNSNNNERRRFSFSHRSSMSNNGNTWDEYITQDALAEWMAAYENENENDSQAD